MEGRKEGEGERTNDRVEEEEEMRMNGAECRRRSWKERERGKKGRKGRREVKSFNYSRFKNDVTY